MYHDQRCLTQLVVVGHDNQAAAKQRDTANEHEPQGND